jgi:hypothetical protein
MTGEQIQKHIYNTYITLRVGLFLLALAFPILLIGIGWLNDVHVQSSMSHYYFAFAPTTSDLRVFPGRVVLVGLLFALGVALILYKGFTKWEDWLLNFAGGAALVAALFPMQAPDYCRNCESSPIFPYVQWVHPAAGLVVFGCLFFVAIRCTEATLKDLTDPDQQKWFRRIYHGIAWLMILTIALAGGMAAYFKITDRMIFFLDERWIFFFEGIGLWMFAAYWLIRSIELSISQAEWNKLTGKEPEPQPSVRDWASGFWASKLLMWIWSAISPASIVKRLKGQPAARA